MQHVDPDMNELFKKAGDEYPLKTDSSDWETVLSKMNGIVNDNEAFQKRTVAYKKLAVGLFSLLMLLPLSLLLKDHFTTQQQEQLNSATTNKENTRDKNRVANNENRKAEVQTSKNLGNADGMSGNGEQASSNVADFSYLSDNKNVKNNVVIANPFLPTLNKKDQNEQNKESTLALPSRVNRHGNEIAGVSSLQESVKDIPAASSKDISNAVVSSVQEEKLIDHPVSFSKPKRFYIGGVFAPELMSVKFQPVNKTSLNIGLLTGYKLNNRFSIELGFMLAHKYYYSDGKYINKNAIRRDNSEILKVNAYNDVTEIPLGVRYDIRSSKNAKLFAGIGVVSYIIHKQQYTYVYTKQGQQMEGVKYNNKAANYWFSNAQLSAGYEQRVGKIGEIRVEPYYRIPLKGIGIGDLHVTSVGLNLALTRSIK